MAQLQNDRFLRALLRQDVDRTPCWMMRQAGRYLPEYRKTREQAGSFMKLCQTPELACEVTLQPLRRFDFDAAIIFSDILTIPDAMKLGLSFAEGEGPRFANPIQNESDINNLPIIDPETDLRYVLDAIRLTRKELNGKVPLIGFSGSPWTLATYMVEGKSSKEFGKIKGLLYSNPQALHSLLDKLADAVILYLNAQIRAGAQAVQIFDTWASVLTQPHYLEYSLQYMNKIIANLIKTNEDRDVPVILFSKGAASSLSHMANSGAHALGIDWTCPIDQARQIVNGKVALQGNMDPCVLYSNPAVVRDEVHKILDAYGNHPGHIFNLGHGIHPGIDPENVKAMVDAIIELSPQYHKRA